MTNINKIEEQQEQEIRLYFYNESKNRLTISENAAKMSATCRYRLDRPGIALSQLSVEKKELPVSDCFILGRVKETIVDEDRGNVDLVEPIYLVKLDFFKYSKTTGWEVKDWDMISLEYVCNVRLLDEQLATLLQFMTKKRYRNDKKSKYIREYVLKSKSYSGSESVTKIARSFNREIKEAFKSGEIARLRELFNVIAGKNV